MNEGHREAVRKSNQRRNLVCKGCGAAGLKELDGSQVGGMPGLKYRVCDGCGWSQALTKRPRRDNLR